MIIITKHFYLQRKFIYGAKIYCTVMSSLTANKWITFKLYLKLRYNATVFIVYFILHDMHWPGH